MYLMRKIFFDLPEALENNYNLSSQFINQNKASIEYILNDYNFKDRQQPLLINSIQSAGNIFYNQNNR